MATSVRSRARPEVAHEVHFFPDGRRPFTRYQVWGAPSYVQWWDAPPATRCPQRP